MPMNAWTFPIWGGGKVTDLCSVIPSLGSAFIPWILREVMWIIQLGNMRLATVNRVLICLPIRAACWLPLKWNMMWRVKDYLIKSTSVFSLTDSSLCSVGRQLNHKILDTVWPPWQVSVYTFTSWLTSSTVILQNFKWDAAPSLLRNYAR